MKYKAAFSKEIILEIFKEHPENAPEIRTKELANYFSLRGEAKYELALLLKEMVDEGLLRKLSGKRFILNKQENLREGRVSLHEKGFSWLMSKNANEEDAFLDPDETRTLMQDDIVRCRIKKTSKGDRGQVIEIVSRGHQKLIGKFELKGKNWQFSSQMCATPMILQVETLEEEKQIQHLFLQAQNIIEVEILKYPSSHAQAEVKFVRLVGSEGDINVEITKIIADSGIPVPFSKACLAQSKALPDVPNPDEYKNRVDLRHLPLCTIDGITAKDFDDAVYAQRLENGWKVYVAIADVSHYVTPNSPLDIDAYERSTSVYYPGKCIPMLPESLSNGLCSLKPKVDRLCMVAEFEVGLRGAMKNAQFYPSVMHSQARLTYADAQEYFDAQSNTDENCVSDRLAEILNPKVEDSLKALLDVSRVIRKKRQQRGAFDFDFVERVVSVDENAQPVSIKPFERHESNRVIEDLMIATNEVVATFFIKQKVPGLFRIHEEPDEEKLDVFISMASRFMPTTFTKKNSLSAQNQKGKKVVARNDSKNIQKLLVGLKDHHLKDVLDNLLLRAMKQARYSADNLGHYGLSSEAYSHFTSPIRRYPDLVIHREIKKYCKGGELSNKKSSKFKAAQLNESLQSQLEDIAVHTSGNERRAVDLERKISALYSAWFVKDKIGLESSARVSSCTDFGVFVRLDEPDVEGLIHISKLGNDFFKYIPEEMRLIGERSGIQIGVGDRLNVAITDVDLEKHQIFLSCLEVTEQRGEKCSISFMTNNEEDSEQDRKSLYERKRAEFMSKNGRTKDRNSDRKKHSSKRGKSSKGKGDRKRAGSDESSHRSNKSSEAKPSKHKKNRKPSQKRSFK